MKLWREEEREGRGEVNSGCKKGIFYQRRDLACEKEGKRELEIRRVIKREIEHKRRKI